MSSQVEASREISSSRKFRDISTSSHADKALFAHLSVYDYQRPHSAAVNMAIDETLLESATIPTIRFYRWCSPALSFGYFVKFSDAAIAAGERDLVRRWTGGGIVFHGQDLTYAVVVPASDPAFRESSTAIYEKIHRALVEALNAIGQPAVVAGGADPGSPAVSLRKGLTGAAGNCFANPVHADVMVDGRKIAGAAQRRTHRGLLQQGSIQGIPTKAGLAQKFAQSLSPKCSESEINDEIFQRARELARAKYGTRSWLRMR